jgi:hypothetical protein
MALTKELPPVPMRYPYSGIYQLHGYEQQPPGTSRLALNTRAYEPSTMRRRGGSRPGLSQYIAAQPAGPGLIQELNVIVSMGGTGVQASQSGRVVTLLAVEGGNVFIADAGASSWSATTNNTGNNPPLNATGVVFSAVNIQKVWFADGTNWCYYDPTTNAVSTWTANFGSLPGVVGSLNTPRLICTWRGRTVVSGLIDDPENWFMSAVGDPTDWDYAGQILTPGSMPSTSPTQAVAGENAPQGRSGDVVTGLYPYTDDVMFFFGDHSIWMMQGDPMAGGNLSLISNAIGGAWGIPVTMDPYGNIYFFSNRTGIYTMTPGSPPQRISQAIEQLLLPVDTGANAIRLLWNDRFQGLHVFISPLAGPAVTTHLFWEMRTNGWTQDQFANNNLNPLAVCTFDGNTPGDRVPIVGSWDGYVRAIDPTATSDDGTAINSEVWLGPLNTEQMDEMLLTELQGVLGASSGDVTFAVYVGQTAEEAFASQAVLTGTLAGGRNLTQLVRRAAHAIYVQLTSTNAWAMEEVRLKIATMGKIRRRGR